MPSYRTGSDPAPGSVFATLRRDKAGGGTRQRKREAGGTPGGVSPCKKAQDTVISPYWEHSIFKKVSSPQKIFPSNVDGVAFGRSENCAFFFENGTDFFIEIAFDLFGSAADEVIGIDNGIKIILD